MKLSAAARRALAVYRARVMHERAAQQAVSEHPRGMARADAVDHLLARLRSGTVADDLVDGYAGVACELEAAMRREQNIERPAWRETMPNFDDVEWAANALVSAVDALADALREFDGSPEALDAVRDAGDARHTAEEILRDTRILYRGRNP